MIKITIWKPFFLQTNVYYKEDNAYCVDIHGYLETIKSIYGTIEFIEHGW